MRAPRVSILAFTAGVAIPYALKSVSCLIAVSQTVGWQMTVAMAVLIVSVSAEVAALDTPAARAMIRRKEGRR